MNHRDAHFKAGEDCRIPGRFANSDRLWTAAVLCRFGMRDRRTGCGLQRAERRQAEIEPSGVH